MTVGNIDWPVMHGVEGVRLGTAKAGIRKSGRKDLVVIEISEGASVTGVYTKNAFAAAPVILGREHLARGDTRYLLINSGCANACTGSKGLEDAIACCEMVARDGNVLPQQVVPFSTGVIGEYLPVDRIASALPDAMSEMDEEGWRDAAEAIMTTDTCPKGASEQFEFDGEVITVSGIAKGAGMIRPNMATLLAFVATDAVVARPVLDKMIKLAADRSFNRISIDGDTSTNDSCLLIATGRAGLPMISEASGPLYDALLRAITSVMQSLAKNIVRDGEGATKFVGISVEGGCSDEECLKVAYTIAHSPLVKTALFASDANWGRIVAAIGYAGIAGLDPAGVSVWLDDVLVVSKGGRDFHYKEAAGAAVVAKDTFSIRVALGRGNHNDTVWTSDLSHQYVTINAEYRT